MAFTLSTLPKAPNPITVVVPENPKKFIIQHCKTSRDLKQVHAHLIKTRRHHHPAVAEPLLEAAALLLRNPDINYAVSIFTNLEIPQASAYNVMIRAFTHSQSPKKSLLLFRQMIEHLCPDEFTISGILKACSKIGAVREGAQIHALFVKRVDYFACREFVENGLVYMYACCGQVEMARKVFDEMPERSSVAWNNMFSGYVRNGHWDEVVRLFRTMLEIGDRFDQVTLINVSTACGRIGDLELGDWICGYVLRKGLFRNHNLATSLVDMYSRCGRVDIARNLFDKMSNRDVVAWSAMIAAYNRSNRCGEALDLFRDMRNANVKPDEVTLVSVASVCAVLGALSTGKSIHSYIRRTKTMLTVNLGTALIDFYAKCGFVDGALEVFDQMPVKNVSAWTALIQGLASNGRGKAALEHFESMRRENVLPNDVTFIAVLGACNHAGLIDKGKRYFDSMSRDFGIAPRIEHYGCVVDMLGRAGSINEAYEFIKSMPIEPSAIVWRTLLAACRSHKNVEIGEEAFNRVVEIEPPHGGDYILLSNLYASVGRSNDAVSLRNEAKRLGAIKNRPGCSYIEIDGTVHRFLAEDKRHPEYIDVYNALEDMMGKIKLAGYVPDTSQARLEAEDDDDREASIAHHGEKLAIAYGLIRTAPGDVIRVTKSLRICNDCHNAAKMVSKVFSREIVVRDKNRFHHFSDGYCSCRDFW
ncbi:pentatricopeptide repeat-containing protein At1g08070, chloroplastic-like [Andrographis paniculata]|uniref:pentatricopeptide repeat-containing protein At1g08070, chloroplastic-like n=1 Tax=Andrographis paniculata TaxID=175694 RepID=UPI0021E8787E|nr:pentatricopeptide repeat-containing protein At1g08070, chloroplastic-like [Andrographis paniculata]